MLITIKVMTDSAMMVVLGEDRLSAGDDTGNDNEDSD